MAVFLLNCRREIPSQRYMKTRVFAFRDINPVAPVHILIV